MAFGSYGTIPAELMEREYPIVVDGFGYVPDTGARASTGVPPRSVSLVNDYLNGTHERALARLVAGIAPEMVVCLSSEVYPKIREYERTSTTAINASLIPIIWRYLDWLEGHLRPFGAQLLSMQSNGGIMSARAAREKPACMIECGPSTGVLAAAQFARTAALPRVLSFDMGGTTAKACLIEDGMPPEKPGGEVGGGATMTTRLFGGEGHALRVPWLDIVEVGAGGGSIAWVDDGGALRVGPRSAGAEPGPVCYGRGGTQPTVTDANVVLGYMNPDAIAGATLSIDPEAARAAIGTAIAEPLGLDVQQAAYGIIRVANATMMRALRAVSTERGRDPCDFALLPFGGAGPIHAATLAENLAIATVHVPIYPGLFSALGLLLADYRHDYIRSLATTLVACEAATITETFARLETEAYAELEGEGVDRSAVRFERRVDLKYGYQVSELSLPYEPDPGADLLTYLREIFTDAHGREFGYVRDDPVELVNLRLRATASADHLDIETLSRHGTASPAHGSRREAYFGPAFGALPTPIHARADLTAATAGPLIVEDADTNIAVPPNWSVRLGALGELILEREVA